MRFSRGSLSTRILDNNASSDFQSWNKSFLNMFRFIGSFFKRAFISHWDCCIDELPIPGGDPCDTNA